MPLDDVTIAALAGGELRDPARVLGLHHDADGWAVNVWLPRCSTVAVRVAGAAAVSLSAHRIPGFFSARLSGVASGAPYALVAQYPGDPRAQIVHDPYRFGPLLSEFDLGLFRAGHHLHLGDILGAHAQTIDGISGVRFAVWAPEATRVSVLGDWNDFDGLRQPLIPRDPYGVWELFVPGVQIGMRYKFELRTATGELRVKADPYAQQAEVPPATASIVADPTPFAWRDATWLERRRTRNHLAKPMAIYEVHLGSWQRGMDGETWPNYRVLAPRLIRYAIDLGFTHLELLPLAQHPFEGSWGYQVTGQYAPNSRHGSPDDLRSFVDQCHAAGLGVIVDFVPGHFPKDDFSLARFDGSACYEYGDPREGEHKTWGTHVFNFRRPEVRNFLLSAALHWIRNFHIDGLRVDAVSSMLYRDYDRDGGEWVANEHGGNTNEEAVSFLQELTSTVRRECAGTLLIAEESTAWQGVTAPTDLQGLGFDLKWNMGWMHDSLDFLELDPVQRAGSFNRATFHQWYAYDDKWVLPLSHDEVVHGKRSLIDKVPGDWWQRRAQLRLLLGYQVAVPGRPLLFQGCEFGQGREFAWDRSVDWDEAAEPDRAGITAFLRAALHLYAGEGALHERDDHRDGFQWVDCEHAAETVLIFLRRAPGAPDVLAACNFTPEPRHDWTIGVPQSGTWTQLLSSDETRFGGSGLVDGGTREATPERRGVFAATLRLTLPPLGIVFWRAPVSSRA